MFETEPAQARTDNPAPRPDERPSNELLLETAGAVDQQTTTAAFPKRWSATDLPRLQGCLLAGLLGLFAAFWLTHLDEAWLVPPMDNIEQLIWVLSLEWGYYKHPPLPTWLIWLPVQFFGVSAAVSYLMGALVTLTSLAICWRCLV